MISSCQRLKKNIWRRFYDISKGFKLINITRLSTFVILLNYQYNEENKLAVVVYFLLRT